VQIFLLTNGFNYYSILYIANNYWIGMVWGEMVLINSEASPQTDDRLCGLNSRLEKNRADAGCSMLNLDIKMF
jgi:hypothetical protein